MKNLFEIPPRLAAKLHIHEHPGYTGAFTRDHATGAYPNGTTISKTRWEDGDRNPIGTEGIVLGSIRHPQLGVFYFVEWTTMPPGGRWNVGQ